MLLNCPCGYILMVFINQKVIGSDPFPEVNRLSAWIVMSPSGGASASTSPPGAMIADLPQNLISPSVPHEFAAMKSPENPPRRDFQYACTSIPSSIQLV